MPTGSLPTDRGASVALAWLSHPVTVLALAVMVVNDHVLKTVYPNALTGKLSDVAGLVLAPPLLAVVVTLLVPPISPRVAAIVGVAGVGIGFVIVKGSPAGAAAASAAWTAVAGPSLVRADATDLLTLPGLAAAWWVWTRARRRPAPPRLVRLARAMVVLPAAVFAVAATSQAQYPQAVAVATWRGALVVGEIDAPQDDISGWTWARISEDAGRTWRWLHPDSEIPDVTAEIERSAAERRYGCVPYDPAVCYRAVPGLLRVEETRDGGMTWHTSWEIDEATRDELARKLPSLVDPELNLASHALVVHPTDTGYVVLVANGRDGYALRDEDGQWRRLGFAIGDATSTATTP